VVHPEAIRELGEKVLSGKSLSEADAVFISEVPGNLIFELFSSANRARQYFRGEKISLCSIFNARSGACTEDCAFCAQSKKSKAQIESYPLLPAEAVLQKAMQAKKTGIKRFSMVTSGKKIAKKDLLSVAGIIPQIRKQGLLPCASLGLLKKEELYLLKVAGLDRYHNNLETSEGFFRQICTSHRYADKVRTIEAAKSAGLSVCSGGIFGMGETWKDRIDLAFALKHLDVDSVPINFLVPIKGTSLERKSLLHPFEALKVISLFRFILPRKEIRICGGRMQILRQFHSIIFLAGADGMITDNYLTTLGRSPEDDIRLIKMLGFTV
jgi:biotin synthase